MACQRPGMSNRRKVKNSAEANELAMDIYTWTYTTALASSGAWEVDKEWAQEGRREGVHMKMSFLVECFKRRECFLELMCTFSLEA